VRKCLVDYTQEDGYRQALLEIETAWKGLFHCYEDRRIPRTNNGMEDFVKRLRSLWRRITGCSVMDEWILYHAPNAVYLFNFIDGHLKNLAGDDGRAGRPYVERA